MKNKLTIMFVLAIAVIAVAAGSFAVFDFDNAERKLCNAAGIYDILTPRLIELYEKEIAGESIVSDKSAAQLKRSAERLGIDVQKLKAIMLVQDIAAKTNRNISLSELAAMSDIKMINYVKQCADDYLSTLTPERKKELENMLKNAMA